MADADVTERAKRMFAPGGSVRALSSEAAVAGAADEMEARGQILRYIAGILVFLGLLEPTSTRRRSNGASQGSNGSPTPPKRRASRASRPRGARPAARRPA